MTEPVSPAVSRRPDIDLRQLLPPAVPTQGMRPLCLPFALSGAHEARHHGSSGALAPEPIWWSCTQRGQTAPGGVLLEHAFDALATVGQTTAIDWPYNPGLGWGTENPPVACGQPPWLQARWVELPLAHDGAEDTIEDVLATSRPIVLVLELTDEFENPEPDGHIRTPPITAATADYHAVLVVGAATHATHGRRLLVRNSWGPHWGAGGYGWLPLAYLVAFAVQAAALT
jgi:hypothetical protein